MYRIFIVLMCFLLSVSCKENHSNVKDENKEGNETAYASFGNVIIADDAISAKSMSKHYNDLREGDSINSKMKATVKKVCQAKGCWMTLDLQNGEEVMVKFKDYGFFLPKDIAGKEVIVNGKAYVKEVSVDELKHYAEDAGKNKEDIVAITKPKRTFSFEADGVLLKE